MEQTTAVILQGVDDRVDAWMPVIHSVQAAYFADKGRYAQSLLMASQHPQDGSTVPLDRPDAHPTDQPEAPVDLFSELPATLRANVQVDVYAGPQGHGYVVVCYHEITSGPDKGLWRRERNFGPETWREVAWHRVEEVEQ